MKREPQGGLTFLPFSAVNPSVREGHVRHVRRNGGLGSARHEPPGEKPGASEKSHVSATSWPLIKRSSPAALMSANRAKVKPAGANFSGGSTVSTTCGRGGFSQAHPQEGHAKKTLPSCNAFMNTAAPASAQTEHSPAT